MSNITFGEWILILVAGLFLTFTNQAHAATATADYEVTSDNEDNDSQRILVGSEFDITPKWKAGFKVGQYEISDNTATRTFDEYRFTYSIVPDNQFSIRGWEGVLTNSDWTTTIGEHTLLYKASSKWNFEGTFERNIIDSVGGVDNNVTFNGITLSADYSITPSLTAVGSKTWLRFSDDNTRDRTVGKLIYSPKALPGFSLMGKVKLTEHDFNPSYYFAPEKWNQYLYGARYRRYFGGDRFMVSASYMQGPQEINDVDGDFQELKLRVKRQMTQRAHIEAFHEQIISTVESYEYTWQWSGIRFRYAF